MKRSDRTVFTIAAIASLLIAAVIMEIVLVFRLTSQQTKESGSNRLSAVCGELEETIGDAKNNTLQVAVAAAPFIGNDDNRESLSRFIHDRKKELIEATHGVCFNTYVAGKGWYIIPDFNATADYNVNERSWYIGAVKNDGTPFVSDPYIDAYTGNICYTVSVLLSDKETVVALDFTMDNIQQHIRHMNRDGSQEAVIVTEEGIIAGCTDETYVGKSLAAELPDYSAIFSLAKSSVDVVTAKSHGENLFAVRSGFGWYLILAENNWTLYRTSYIQMMAMIVISVAVFAVIIVMYIMSVRTAKRAEDALLYKEEFLTQITGELQEPLHKIITGSSKERIENSTDFQRDFADINEAGKRLSERINKIISYSNILRNQKKEKKDTAQTIKKSRHFRSIILTGLLLVMGISVFVNISYSYRLGKNKVQREVNTYEAQLSEWINTQKSILDMFCSLLSTNPDMLNSYSNTVSFLDKITKQYPEISVTYLANPASEPTVYMNNGWLPDADWRVEEREWYKSTLNSKDGWSISSPYYDEQTGLYCLTFSKKVYRGDNGDFLGIFGIDFYMDKLVDILGSSYSDNGYAFLADSSGTIINHPYGSYQMSKDNSVNILEISFYSDVSVDNEDISFVSDYDDHFKIISASKDNEAGFTVYVVRSLWSVYGSVMIYSVVLIVLLTFCTVLVYKIMTSLIGLQEEANIKLKESADAAIAADAAKSSFLAQMSHEIRTPINAVLGLNEMILRESSDSSIREYSTGIQSAGRTLLSLINSILDFSKIEDGKMEIVTAEYDTASLVNDLVTSILQRAQSKGLEFKVNADKDLPAAMLGDDVRISQVIANLLTNAVKYTESGTVTLTIRKDSVSADGTKVVIYVEVADTGIGIREEDIEGLYESFKRLDEKRNRNIEGTGLGISIVTKLLEMMNSKLEVSSVYGEGSVFGFRLEQGIVNPEPMGDYNERLKAFNEQKQDTVHLYAPKARVLVIDDNEMNLRVASGLMKINGIIPDSAGSGSEALKMIAERHYDMIFLDHMMPVMDGLEVMKKIKEGQLIDGTTSVIALTANAIVGAREMYLEAGFDDYLTKPIEIRALEKKLERYLPAELVSYRDAEKPSAEAPVQEEPQDSDSFTMSDLARIHELVPGINMMTAMEYCMESKEFYYETLQSYLDSERSEEIEKAFEAGDIKNYGILVHSLKSSSLTIGAELLSDHAKALEFAAKREDKAFIENGHRPLMEEYRRLLDGVREVLKK